MSEVDVNVTVGGVTPLTVTATTTTQVVVNGGGVFAGWSLRDATGDVAASANGSVVAPAAGATIVSLAGLAAGTYQVSVTVGLQGAAAAGDANNFQLFNGASLIGSSVNPGAAGEYPQPTVEVTVAAGGTLAVKALGAGTAGVTYSATISIDPLFDVETQVEIISGQTILGEPSMTAGQSDTQFFGPVGPAYSQGVTVNVLKGAVKGTVYVVNS